MAHWADARTAAFKSVAAGLSVVDNLLSFTKDGQGAPSGKERALFAAAVVFTYGVWENFVEQLAIELASKLSPDIPPEHVPEQIRKSLEKKTPWELAVHPGWRVLWSQHIAVQAIGDNGDKFGMNTAKAGQVKNLLSQAGASEPYQKIPAAVIPAHLPRPKRNVDDAINALVELRGEIVHTGTVPNALRKGHVRDWRNFVAQAADSIDEASREQCKKLYK